MRARGRLRCGSLISSATGETLIQPWYAQITLTIAARNFDQLIPPNSAGQTGEMLDRRGGYSGVAVKPRMRKGRRITPSSVETLTVVTINCNTPPQRTPRMLTTVRA